MLPKVPKSNFWKLLKSGAKIIFIAEAVGFAVSYGIYHHMNTSQEFRGYMNAQFPFVLDYYYKLGEFIGNSKVRQIDAAVWNAAEQRRD